MLARCNATLISTLFVYFSTQSSSASSPTEMQWNNETMQMNSCLAIDQDLYDVNVCGSVILMPHMCDAHSISHMRWASRCEFNSIKIKRTQHLCVMIDVLKCLDYTWYVLAVTCQIPVNKMKKEEKKYEWMNRLRFQQKRNMRKRIRLLLPAFTFLWARLIVCSARLKFFFRHIVFLLWNSQFFSLYVLLMYFISSSESICLPVACDGSSDETSHIYFIQFSVHVTLLLAD